MKGIKATPTNIMENLRNSDFDLMSIINAPVNCQTFLYPFHRFRIPIAATLVLFSKMTSNIQKKKNVINDENMLNCGILNYRYHKKSKSKLYQIKCYRRR